ncbi:tyrosine-type recombinase/integrase [Floricoccus penangensis]|uniref:tyrosine-type recombinase/integrase n=1 Tax=Floricoccus penangensis TaxID=1859475 RepID=UPI00203E8D3F|nr:tyrosine-type recombinase/integrase [Floricoccus penangensis]
MKKDWLNRKLNKIEKLYNLPHIVPHGFRHTFVSNSLMLGIDESYLKSIVGHAESSNVTRNVYGHINKDKQEEVINELYDFNNLKIPDIEVDEINKTTKKGNKIIQLVTNTLPNGEKKLSVEKQKL